jgi:hypothetical protein
VCEIISHLHFDSAPLWKSVTIECLQSFKRHEVGSGHRRAGVSCQLDTVEISDLQITAFKGAKELAERVVQFDRLHFVEKRWIVHRAYSCKLIEIL